MSIPVSIDPLGTLGASPLPPGYRQVDFVTLDRKVDTGLLPAANDTIETSFRFNDFNAYYAAFASFESDELTTRRVILGSTNNLLYVYYGDIPAVGQFAKITLESGVRGNWFAVRLDPSGFTLQGVRREYPDPSVVQRIPVAPYYLGRTCSFGEFIVSAPDGTERAHLIPAMNPQGLECLYDIVRKLEF